MKSNTTPITIEAMLGAISGSTTLTVTPALLVSIAVTPVNPTITAGQPLQFTATGTFSDSTTGNITNEVTWSSLNMAIAKISNAPGSQGVATGLMQGSTTITAMKGTISGETTMTVTCPAITITTASPLPMAIIRFPYEFGEGVQLETTGGIKPITFTLISGNLPDGMTLSLSGLISGTPTLNNPTGIFTFTIQATSSCGNSTTKQFDLVLTIFPGKKNRDRRDFTMVHYGLRK